MGLEVISKLPAKLKFSTPLLFVHGAWHGAWCWDEYFLDYFSKLGFAAYALSLRGHGSSLGRERLRWTRLADYVKDVSKVAAGLSKPPVVIGHSMGGAVVQKYLETHSAPAAVLLASVPPRGTFAATMRIARNRPLKFAKTNFLFSLYPLIGTPDLAHRTLFSAEMPKDKVSNYFPLLQDESYLAYLDMMIFNLPRPKRVKTPVLVIGGAKDAIFRPREIKATARAYNSQALIFPDMAHNDLIMGSGWQKVTEQIYSWLKDKPL